LGIAGVIRLVTKQEKLAMVKRLKAEAKSKKEKKAEEKAAKKAAKEAAKTTTEVKEVVE
tara:strand:+ start:19 stop:195 length:177 start_codon:yes stop_codon:yes gene_type:complete